MTGRCRLAAALRDRLKSAKSSSSRLLKTQRSFSFVLSHVSV